MAKQSQLARLEELENRLGKEEHIFILNNRSFDDEPVGDVGTEKIEKARRRYEKTYTIVNPRNFD